MIRLMAAPISWGICEMPGWGRMLSAERVLSEMTELGIVATEFGAPGFLPDGDVELTNLLDRFGVSVTGGFVPVVVHDPAVAEATVAEARRIAETFRRRGASLFIAAAVVAEGWSPRFRMTDEQVAHTGAMLDRLSAVTAEYGVELVLHPHTGTLVETAEDIERVLAASSCKWCLDTGHMAIGGCDVVDFARRTLDRVGLVHLKDVDMALAARYNAKEISWMEVVQAGLFHPLGVGEVPVAEVIDVLEKGGYQGWYVLEQDVAITGDEPEYGTGPVLNVRKSVEYLRSRYEVVAA
ncbi:MAG: sugar phosphate isomerase/epimerase family protein [Ilumatobacteraceae bacterium]